MTARKPKREYTEHYGSPGLRLRSTALPKLLHTNGLRADEMYVREAGRLSDGREYQVLYVVLQKEDL